MYDGLREYLQSQREGTYVIEPSDALVVGPSLRICKSVVSEFVHPIKHYEAQKHDRNIQTVQKNKKRNIPPVGSELGNMS